jgi:hypothetical protein
MESGAASALLNPRRVDLSGVRLGLNRINESGQAIAQQKLRALDRHSQIVRVISSLAILRAPADDAALQYPFQFNLRCRQKLRRGRLSTGRPLWALRKVRV